MILKASFAEASQVLEEFVDRSGDLYTRHRNYDLGPGRQNNVSHLSPYLSRRIILPEEVIAAVHKVHGPTQASQFCREVLWQSYWRGWLSMRPQVWRDAQKIMNEDTSQLQAALAGDTGIDAFDSWVDELKTTGYLHNHARMWFASIWIHTLKLDWKQGARFFQNYLIDYDSASNTLSWRWVAGLHTRNKYYLATKENIDRFTQGRFQPSDLAQTPVNLDDEVSCRIQAPITHLTDIDPQLNKNKSWVIMADDCSVHRWKDLTQSHVIIVHPKLAQPSLCPITTKFNENVVIALKEAIPQSEVLENLDDFTPWVDNTAQDGLVWVKPSIGVYQDFAEQLKHRVPPSVTINEIRRPWDQYYFPLATHGFFDFKKKSGFV